MTKEGADHGHHDAVSAPSIDSFGLFLWSVDLSETTRC